MSDRKDFTKQQQLRHEESVSIDQQIARLEEDVRRLKIDFDIYFNGGSKRPPYEARGRVEAQIKKLSDKRNLTYSQRYLLNSIISRYNSYKDLWRRIMKARNEPFF
ncbi:MAG: hypothetical protein N2Z23_09210 [Pyrinomonadaceae bacterium]|nr:hypothetical protein [Pyrinomonadaceae bacterium]MCX7640600.1 hypothetical protein [Pyrinomonadaceae bacterium]MDW8303819.1 hypothetical protein [Acidobacteriota bacterium]